MKNFKSIGIVLMVLALILVAYMIVKTLNI